MRRNKPSNDARINEEISSSQIRVIDENGEALGVMTTIEALEIADDRDYDLVEIAPDADPPVCKLMDYGKFKYEKRRKEKEAKKKQHVIHVKEVRFRPMIEEHDFQTKIKKAKKFLEAKNKLKITVMFRGREMTHLEYGDMLMDKIKAELEEISVISSDASREGRFITAFFMPK